MDDSASHEGDAGALEMGPDTLCERSFELRLDQRVPLQRRFGCTVKPMRMSAPKVTIVSPDFASMSRAAWSNALPLPSL